MSTFEDTVYKRVAARRKLTEKGVEIFFIEACISDDETAVVRLLKAEEEQELLALELANLVDESPERTRPKGWPAKGECA
jgi:hypothetical protein